MKLHSNLPVYKSCYDLLPEELTSAEDVKKVEGQLAGDEKKMLKEVKKIRKKK
ncbi:MAG: hypothetical protein JW973_17555 [Bacteroidales bacterium]|nr:hypothetical protein [Bacteroidales bacterium]